MSKIEDRVYEVAGYTEDATGAVKIRYSADELESRVKLYTSQGYPVVKFMVLPKPMNKISICKYFLVSSQMKSEKNWAAIKAAIEVELSKKEALIPPAIPRKRGRPAKAASTVSTIKPAKKVVASSKKKEVKSSVPKAKPLKIGEVETLESQEEEVLSDDFDIRQYAALADFD